MESNAIREFYDRFAGQQARTGTNKRHHLIRALAKAHGLRSDMSVLEIGCGIGTLTRLLSEELRHGRLTAVDISPKSIEAAAESLTGRSNVDLKVVDIITDQMEGKFDMIILPDVLEHIPYDVHQRLFTRLSDLLAVSGRILIHGPDPVYTEWLRQNRPELLQVVDLPIHLARVIKDIGHTDLVVHHFQRHSIWTSSPDYMAIVLGHRQQDPDYSVRKGPEQGRSVLGRLKGILK